MINIPTVFVIGAGASKPYGLPTSLELTNQIAIHILDRNSTDVRSAKLKEIGAPPPEDFIEMAHRLQAIGQMSIDEWLARNDRYLECGRISISYLIATREGQDRSVAKEQDWLADLWVNYLSTNCPKISDLSKNQATFITFNYDRSIEHYLYQFIINTYSSASAEEIVTAVRNFKIIHVHGQVGLLPWQDASSASQCREFRAERSWERAVSFCRQVKIIGELEPKTSEYINARQSLAKAKRICFLGFGYHDENMKRLSPSTDDEAVKGTEFVIGSAFELDRREFKAIEEGKSPIKYPVKLSDNIYSCADFIKRALPRN